MNAKAMGILAASAMSMLAANARAEIKVTTDKSGERYYCQNNKCAGNSQCGGAGNQNGCAGQNTCKGKGWLDASDKASCEAQGKGKWVKLEATKSKK